MNEPKKPADHPHDPAQAPGTPPAGGTPEGVSEAEPKGSPTSDRHKTESSADD